MKKYLENSRERHNKRLSSFRDWLLFYERMGYKAERKSMSHFKANMVALVFVPICALLYVAYASIHGWDTQLFSRPMWKYILFFIVAFILAAPVHEFLHGLTWSRGCEHGLKDIFFGLHVKTMTPWCGCGEPLDYWTYALGTAMPTLMMGLMPYVVGLASGIYCVAAFGIVNILAGGGDMILLIITRKCHGCIMMDFPNAVGCMVIRK